MILKPATDEYAPFYAGYVNAVDTEDIVQYLEDQKTALTAFFHDIKWEQWDQAYAPGKWTLAELVVHVIDAERIFAYRALRIARGDKTPLPGFDENEYVPNSGATLRTPASIVDEWAAVREAGLQLFRNFTPEMWERRGTASNAEISVRALAWITAGHAAHHWRIVRERYLAQG